MPTTRYAQGQQIVCPRCARGVSLRKDLKYRKHRAYDVHLPNKSFRDLEVVVCATSGTSPESWNVYGDRKIAKVCPAPVAQTGRAPI